MKEGKVILITHFSLENQSLVNQRGCGRAINSPLKGQSNGPHTRNQRGDGKTIKDQPTTKV